MKRILLVLTLAAALALSACSPSASAIATGVAGTQAALQSTTAAQAQTQTAGAPSATPLPTDTKVPTATATDEPSATPTDTPVPTKTHTPVPSATSLPTDTATPAATNTKAPPLNTATPTTPPTQPGPDFITTAKAVRVQVDSIGGQIDLALQVGFIDCQQLVTSYEFVVNRHDLNVPGNLAVAYATYQSAIDKFIDRVHDIYGNCAGYLADPSSAGTIPQQQWGTARLGINETSPLLAQAITEAGGTP